MASKPVRELPGWPSRGACRQQAPRPSGRKSISPERAVVPGPGHAGEPGDHPRRRGEQWSAGDFELVDDDRDAARHPRGADHRVALGPGPDVAGKDDRAPAGVDPHVTVVGNEGAAVEGPPDELLDVGRLDAADDVDLVPDLTDVPGW